MSQKKHTLQEKLKHYSLLVAPVIASAEMANAQIVYHDIEPDAFYKDSIIGDNYTSPVLLDLDNDGVYDIEFAVWSSVQSENGPNKVNIAGARQYGANENAIMGYTNLFNATFCSTVLPLYCPSALNEGKLIKSSANFWAIPGTTNLGTLIRFFRNISPPNNFVGQWNDLTDRYVGLRFKGGDSKIHFGWIRMDVTKSPASFTLKDYAYELQDNVSIKAGDAGSIGVSQVHSSNGFSILNEDGFLTIIIQDGRFEGATVTINNMLGQVIFEQSLYNTLTRLNSNESEKGIYVVTVHRNSESFSKEIVF